MELNTLEEKLQIVKAQHEGREIECWSVKDCKWKPKILPNSNFAFKINTYRVKPEPQLTHWEFEDYPKVPRYYRHIDNGDIRTIWFKNYGVAFQGSIYSYEDFAKFHELIEEDGSLTPLYKKVEEEK